MSDRTEQNPITCITIGRIGYTEAWALQKRLSAARGADEIGDMILFLEHPHTYTLGSSGHPENILFSADELADHGIEVHTVDRGGDVTYHGPGQLVGYPILKLNPSQGGLHADVVGYVRQIEEALIDALASYGISAWPYPGYTGVWVGDEESHAKIAAIGVKVTTRRVTFHGFALNVNTDMNYFKGIIPCGISDKPVTSMEQLSGKPVDMLEVTERIARSFGKLFDRDIHFEEAAILSPFVQRAR